MRPFDLEKAKAGAPVCTNDGKAVRILCFDKKDKSYPIVVLVEHSPDSEVIQRYTPEGRYSVGGGQHTLDLRMASVKKSGWVNVYNVRGQIEVGKEVFVSSQLAKDYPHSKNLIDTVKIKWDE